MYYEINVSKNGKHFFATHARSITTEDKMWEVYSVLEGAFPKSNGYSITVTKWKTSGEDVDLSSGEKEVAVFDEFYQALNEAKESIKLMVTVGKLKITIIRTKSVMDGLKVYADFEMGGLTFNYQDRKMLKWFGEDRVARDKYFDELKRYLLNELNNGRLWDIELNF